MRAIFAVPSQTFVGWLSGDVLLNVRNEPCAFVRGHEVFTFNRRHVGVYNSGQFRNAQGAVVGMLNATQAAARPRRTRRRRFQITPWLGFSVPAPRPAMTFRPWAIWDHAIDTLSA